MLLRKLAINGILAAILMTIAPREACAQEPIVTFKGYILDSACAFIKNLKEARQRRLRSRLRQSWLPLGDSGGRWDDLVAHFTRDAHHRTEPPFGEICRAETDRQREGFSATRLTRSGHRKDRSRTR